MGFIKYTFSMIDDANYCLMRYWLRWIEKDDSLNPPFFKKGTLFHELLENFWNRLGTPEEVSRTKKKKGGKKYSNADEFSNYAGGKWLSEVIGAENSKNPKSKIDWEYEGQKYKMKEEIKNISHPIFPILVERGKPLYQEIPFDFVLGNRRFRGRIDSIRMNNGKVVVEDFKTGKQFIGEMKVKHDPQMTLYNVGLGALCYADEKFAKSLGLEKLRKNFLGNPFFVYEEIENEFFMLEAPYMNEKLKERKKDTIEIIHKTKRKDAHFFEILKMLDGIENSIKNNVIYPERGRKCDSCVMKKACEKKLEDAIKEVPEDKNGQTLLKFVAPIFSFSSETNNLIEKSRQLDLFKKEKKITSS